MTTAETAKALAERGFAVFPVREDKTPYASDGLKSATLDPYLALDTFEKFPKALIAIHCGMSGLAVLDIDYKEHDGEILVDGFEALDLAWLDIPESFEYASLSGKGKHILYAAPEGKNLAPKSAYRGMKGVDRRSGESYIVFTATDLPNKRDLVEAPEWLCDESSVKSAAAFEGTVKDWYDTLEPGEPSLIVRAAMDRTRALFESLGEDFSHGDVVERQYEAVRLGAERHSGVPELLALIEELFYARTGSHSRPESEWAYEFAEGLASGIAKYGDTIDLYKSLPEYNITKVPAGVSDALLTGAAGTKEDFRVLLRALQEHTQDDLLVTSILWGSPETKDLAREWGLEFIHKRVTDARAKPEPVRENPTLPQPAEPTDNSKESHKSTENGMVVPGQGGTAFGTFLTADEQKTVSETYTFIDQYLEASASKGFSNRAYAIPAAWTALSMAFGLKASISKGVSLGMNLWFIPLGLSGTGKAQPLDSQVLTPSGFKRMGDMAVGDTVVVPSGGEARVTGVYPQGIRPVYTLTFADGRTVEADEDHLWTVRKSGPTKNEKTYTMTTKELLGDLAYETKSKWFVDNIEAPDLGSWGSIIDPYSLGLLLGDGGFTNNTVRFTTVDSELEESLRGALPAGLELRKVGTTVTFGVSGTRPKKNPWTQELARLGLGGVKSQGKFVPTELLHSSKEDRLALLQGLMDTDGSPGKNGNSADYVGASKRLRDDIVWLTRSLGGRATVSEKMVVPPNHSEPRTYYRAYLALPEDMSFFRLTRKVSKINAKGKYPVGSLAIRSIEFKGYELTQCIRVDHPDHEYVTDGFTRTHNTAEVSFLKHVLDHFLKDGDGYYNLGAMSSPEGILLELLTRDGKPSMIFQDEAATFFSALQTKDYMRQLEYDFSNYYMGDVPPSNKISLKEFRGKSAETSFNLYMIATPDKLLTLINTDMFATGFLARVNWIWAAPPTESDDKYRATRSENNTEKNAPTVTFDLSADLAHAAKTLPDRVDVWGTPEAVARLEQAHKEFDKRAKGHEKYVALEPAITRLGRETTWKCAALLALYRGETTFTLTDVLVALSYAEEWYDSLIRAVEATSESDFSRDVNEIEAYIRAQNGPVTEAKLNHRFRSLIQRSPRELSERIDFLRVSGRVNRVEADRKVEYVINE